VPVITKDLGGWNAGKWQNIIIDSTGTTTNLVQARYVRLAIAPDNSNLWGAAGFHRTQPIQALFYRSTDGGATWSEPIVVANAIPGNTDSTHVQALVERTAFQITFSSGQKGLGAFAGRLTNADRLARPFYSFTNNGGQTWLKPLPIPGTVNLDCGLMPGGLSTFVDGQGDWHVFAIGDNAQEAGTKLEIYDLKFANGSWTITKVISPLLHPLGLNFGFRSKSPLHPALGKDGTIYLAYTDLVDTTGVILDPARETQKTDVFIVKSRDGGKTWSRPVNVTQTPRLAENFIGAAPVVTDKIHLTYTAEPSEDIEPWYLYYLAVPVENITGVAEAAPPVRIPSQPVLWQNRPNPVAPGTTIAFELQQSETLTLIVFNMLGQEVAILANGVLPAGRHHYSWNGAGLPAGIYFYRLQTARFSMTKKMILLR